MVASRCRWDAPICMPVFPMWTIDRPTWCPFTFRFEKKTSFQRAARFFKESAITPPSGEPRFELNSLGSNNSPAESPQLPPGPRRWGRLGGLRLLLLLASDTLFKTLHPISAINQSRAQSCQESQILRTTRSAILVGIQQKAHYKRPTTKCPLQKARC